MTGGRRSVPRIDVSAAATSMPTVEGSARTVYGSRYGRGGRREIVTLGLSARKR